MGTANIAIVLKPYRLIFEVQIFGIFRTEVVSSVECVDDSDLNLLTLVKEIPRTVLRMFCSLYSVSEKDCTLFLFFFLGAQCVESGVSCTDCY